MPVRRSSKTGKVILLVADDDASIQRDTCLATSNGLRALRWNNLLMPCAEKTLRRPTPQRLKVESKGSLEAWSDIVWVRTDSERHTPNAVHHDRRCRHSSERLIWGEEIGMSGRAHAMTTNHLIQPHPNRLSYGRGKPAQTRAK